MDLIYYKDINPSNYMRYSIYSSFSSTIPLRLTDQSTSFDSY